MNDNVFVCRESLRLNEKYYETVHRSGLRIYVFPKKFSTCYAVLGTRFGSADERFMLDGKLHELPLGTAHFLEHKLFENEYGGTADDRFAALGAETNAYTTYTATRYLFSATKRYGECLSELLKFVTHPYFTRENVKKERGIIAQEIKMYADDPYDKVMENCLKAMYRHNSVRNNICGTPSSLKKINEDILYRAHGIFYNPSNMVLSVCGDITPDEVLRVADEVLPRAREPFSAEHIFSDENGPVYKSYTEKRMRVARPLFFIGIKDKTTSDGRARTRRSLGMAILNNMLFSGTGEFYNRLLRERLITPGFSFGYSSGSECAMNYFSGNSDDPEKVASEIFKKTESAASGELSRDDFIRCRRSSLAGFCKSFDSSAEIADDVLQSVLNTGLDPFEIPAIIEDLTFEEIKALAAEVFGRQDARTISLILPLEDDKHRIP